MGRIKGQRVMASKCLTKGIERAGTDIAENNADGANRQLKRTLLVAMMVRQGIGRRSRGGMFARH